jgi:hypothetical protein
LKPRKPIRRRSLKKQAEDKIYFARRKIFLAANPLCAISVDLGENPPRLATDIHHMKGRLGKNYLDEQFWLPVSRHWHRQLHDNPKWAKENNYIIK